MFMCVDFLNVDFIVFLLGIVAILWWGRCGSHLCRQRFTTSFLRIGVVFLGLDFRRWLFFAVFPVFVFLLPFLRVLA